MNPSVGIDTCVVLRLLTGLPEAQARSAQTFVEASVAAGTRVFVNDIVVIEAYHALIYFYDVPKMRAIETLNAFLATPGIFCKGHATHVLAEYRGTGAGLADRLIRAQLLEHTRRIASFDKDFCKLPGVSALT